MKISEEIDIDGLYFGMLGPKKSGGSSTERCETETYNLFDNSSVKRAVALWVTMDDDLKKKIMDPMHFCFSDYWGRSEYEFILCPWPYKDGALVEKVGQKVDMFKMYIEPNAELLMSLVDRVTVSSAKKYLSKERRRCKR